MNVKMPPDGRDILRYMQGQPLDFDPGKEFCVFQSDLLLRSVV